MNNRCNRWLKMNPLHLVLSAVVIYVAWYLVVGSPWGVLAAELPVIQRRGYVKIAVKDNLPPLGFRDKQGKLQGLEIDLAQRLASDLLGKENAVKLQPVVNEHRLSVVLDHEVDLSIARVTATPSRARLVDFSVPYYFDGGFLVTKNPEIKEIGDLENLKVAVISNSSTIADVKYYVPNVKIVGVDSYQSALALTENNTVVAFAADGSVLTGWVQAYPQYRLLPTKLSTEPLAVVMPKGIQYHQLRQKVNEAIAQYIAEGWLAQRIAHWGLP